MSDTRPKGVFNPETSDGFSVTPDVVYWPMDPNERLATNKLPLPFKARPYGRLSPETSEAFISVPDDVYSPMVPLFQLATYNCPWAVPSNSVPTSAIRTPAHAPQSLCEVIRPPTILLSIRIFINFPLWTPYLAEAVPRFADDSGSGVYEESLTDGGKKLPKESMPEGRNDRVDGRAKGGERRGKGDWRREVTLSVDVFASPQPRIPSP